MYTHLGIMWECFMYKSFTPSLTRHLMKGENSPSKQRPLYHLERGLFSGFDWWWQFKSTSITAITFFMLKSCLYVHSFNLATLDLQIRAQSKKEKQKAGSLVWMQITAAYTMVCLNKHRKKFLFFWWAKAHIE